MMQNEVRRLEVTGIRSSKRIGNKLVVEGLKAYKMGYDPVNGVPKYMEMLQELLLKTMIVFHLWGELRTASVVAPKIKKNKLFALDLYDKAIDVAKKRLALTSEDIQTLSNVYGPRCVTVVSEVNTKLEQKLKETIARTTAEGMHVKQGMIEIRKAYDAAGVTPKGPYLLENIFRTQTQIAYEAGRWNMLQDEDIQDILWGFQYVTAEDDRVRINHQELDGTKLPKEDPFWSRFWPPNGYNCRCSVIEIFKDETPKIKAQPDNAKPDEGWSFNPGMVHGVKTSIQPMISGKIVGKVKKEVLPIKKAVVVKPIVTPVKEVPTKPIVPTKLDSGALIRTKILELDESYKSQIQSKSIELSQTIKELNLFTDEIIEKHPEYKKLLSTYKDKKISWHEVAETNVYKKFCQARTDGSKPFYLKMRVLEEEKATLSKSLKEEIIDKLVLSKTERIAVKGLDDLSNEFSKAVKKKIKSAQEFLEKITSNIVMKGGVHCNIQLLTGSKIRAGFQGGRVYIGSRTPISVILHEMGHVLEDSDAIVRFKAKMFLKERAAGFKLTPLNKLKKSKGYRPDEMAWKDKFIDSYMGKYYSNSTELLSMGLEYLYKNPVLFAKKDPEMFEWLVDLLRKL